MNRNGIPPIPIARFGNWALHGPLFRARNARVPSEWMTLKPMPRKCAASFSSRSDEPIHSVRKLGSLGSSAFWRTTALSARWPCSGLPWRWRERGIRVRFRRGSLRNGYHFYGGQQARKLPNAEKRVRQWKEIGLLDTIRCLGDSNGEYSNPLNIE